MLAATLATAPSRAGEPEPPSLGPQQASILRCTVSAALTPENCRALSPVSLWLIDPDRDRAALRRMAEHPPLLADATPGATTELAVRPDLDWPTPAPGQADPPTIAFAQRTWLAAQGPEVTTTYYPERALRMGLAGDTQIRCLIDASGVLNPCWVLWESDPAQDFGAAAMRVSTFYRMTPTTRDGRPTVAGSYRLRIIFALPGS